MTLYDLLNEGSAALQQAGDTDGENDAKLLLFEALHLDLVHFLMDRLRPLSEQDAEVQEQIRTYREMIEKRASRIPLQQILGSQEFMGLDFFVNEHVLIPRQDTETLVELVLQEQQEPEKKLLDLCTGSGCILVSLLHYAKGTAGTGADLSGKALAVAKGNVEANGVEARLVQGDLFEPVTGTFDLIVSNPPYIASAEIETLTPEVREHEPRMALDGTADGLFFYKRIVQESPSYLKEGGWLCMEIGYDQGAVAQQLMEARGFVTVSVIKDLAGLDRVVSGCYRRNRNV